MTQEEKELLLKDLCARLPYGVIVYLETGLQEKLDMYSSVGVYIESCRCKSYLRQMSSMTEEEKKEYQSLCEIHTDCDADDNVTYYYFDTIESFDWLNQHHFDHRGLIEKGLAISTDKFNPYKD